MALNNVLVTQFRKARGNLLVLLNQQALFLRLDLEARIYVVPCLRRQIPQYLDILSHISRQMAIESRHHPYVLFHPRDLYSETVPRNCAALKGQCAHLANRFCENQCTDISISVARVVDDIIANLPF